MYLEKTRGSVWLEKMDEGQVKKMRPESELKANHAEPRRTL